MSKPTIGNSRSVRTYSSSFNSSKNQTPIKSPSPDNAHMNALTPTKLKYYIDSSKNTKVCQILSQQQGCIENSNKIIYQQEQIKIYRDFQSGKKESTPISNPHISQQGNQNKEYIKSLLQRINLLESQNRNLLKKLATQKQNKLNYSPLSAISGNQIGNYNSLNQARAQLLHISQNRRTQIMEKIKEQYEQKINTLKMMVQQQIKQAIGVIEDMCEIMKNKIIGIEKKVQAMQDKVTKIKIDKILKLQEGFNRTINISGNGIRLNNSRKQFIGFHSNGLCQNSLSDILCVSIPEEQQEESKNYTVTITKLEQQIENLRKTIDQTQNVYKKQKVNLIQILEQKNNQIVDLRSKLEESQRKKHSIEWKYNKSIKQELRLLQINVNQLGQQLIKSQSQYQVVVSAFEEKNIEMQKIQRQMIELKQKSLNFDKQKIYYEQKIRFLQNNIKILQNQLKQRKKILSEVLVSKSNLERERIVKMSTQNQKFSTQRNMITLTSRIDRLLALQKQREDRQRWMLENYQMNKKQNGASNQQVIEGTCNSQSPYLHMSYELNQEEGQRTRQKDKEQQTMTITER